MELINNYVYILECVDKTFYIGYTTNLENRFLLHNKSKAAKYTRGRTPVILKYYEILENKSEALKKEIYLKKLTKIRKINYIKNNITSDKLVIINKINNMRK